MSYAVQFENVSRHFGEVRAVDSVTLAINEGEFFSMLGPSGSGKTTCLRLIAGFEQSSAGHILIHGRDVTNIPPYERDVNTVFQDYALFPHMSVLDNVAYGLMVKGVGKKQRLAQAQEALERVDLGFVRQRKPWQLSGGQRQRVALARALVNRPGVLLLDEPLGALDLKLREQMQLELKTLQRSLGITFVFVTHDQSEALSMSDRVAVFNNGRIEQVDTPRVLYNQPATEFVARFVGTANVLSGETCNTITGKTGSFALRPEYIQLNHQEAFQTQGTVREVQYFGATTRLDVQLASGEHLLVSQTNTLGSDCGLYQPGQAVALSWPEAAMVRLAEESR